MRGGAGLGRASVGGWGVGGNAGLRAARARPGWGESGAVSPVGLRVPGAAAYMGLVCDSMAGRQVRGPALSSGGAARGGVLHLAWQLLLPLGAGGPGWGRERCSGAVSRHWALGGSEWSGAVVSSILAESLRSQSEISYRAFLRHGKLLFPAPPAGLGMKGGFLSPSCCLIPVIALLAVWDALCSSHLPLSSTSWMGFPMQIAAYWCHRTRYVGKTNYRRCAEHLCGSSSAGPAGAVAVFGLLHEEGQMVIVRWDFQASVRLVDNVEPRPKPGF